MSEPFPDETSVMRRALELADRGLGRVEPNPPVGAVLVDDRLRLLGEGAHLQFGGPHAEVHALDGAGANARGATLFVTLEPCCHFGKTPPCSQAVIEAGIKRVVIATRDPAPHVNGGGIAQLQQAGIAVGTGLLAQEAILLAAPFFKRVTTRRPFVQAKWAMTLDGKIASRSGHSQWISNESARGKVHDLRGRMDAIVVGSTTARCDDPLLTARPSGPRVATRIVIDRELQLDPTSRLLTTLDQAPVLIATSESAEKERGRIYRDLGAEVLPLPGSADSERHLDLGILLLELGRREMTNVLVEGGGGILGDLFDRGEIDACHVFLAPKLVGGSAAPGPLAGRGLDAIPRGNQFLTQHFEPIEDNIYFHGVIDSPWLNRLINRR
jgi:diaminohydroxyphosphoribosylaminopyrimidine deaminase / 5-amino-6-(5-phosphoribosylamino)uracil reductase